MTMDSSVFYRCKVDGTGWLEQLGVIRMFTHRGRIEAPEI